MRAKTFWLFDWRSSKMDRQLIIQAQYDEEEELERIIQAEYYEEEIESPEEDGIRKNKEREIK